MLPAPLLQGPWTAASIPLCLPGQGEAKTSGHVWAGTSTWPELGRTGYRQQSRPWGAHWAPAAWPPHCLPSPLWTPLGGGMVGWSGQHSPLGTQAHPETCDLGAVPCLSAGTVLTPPATGPREAPRWPQDGGSPQAGGCSAHMLGKRRACWDHWGTCWCFRRSWAPTAAALALLLPGRSGPRMLPTRAPGCARPHAHPVGVPKHPSSVHR